MNKIKKGLVYIIIIISLSFLACNNDEEDEELFGNWVKKSSFDGPARSSAASFVIGNYAYIVAGYNGDNYLNDVWAYSVDGDFWEQKADFIGSKRSAASAFELNEKGYVGLGYDGTNKLKDFYQYDPVNNTWQQKADFGGTARYGAVGFQVGGKAFFGTGYDGNFLKDFYQYIPEENVWVTLSGFSGNKRKNAVVFVIDDKAYIGTGTSNNVNQVDFWEFNSTNGIWTRKRDIDQDDDDGVTFNDDYLITRSNACGFSINGLGYVACGENSRSVWQYDPNTDLWDEKTSLEASSRTDAVGLTISGKGFVLLGRSSTTYFDDTWEFKPNEAQNDNDN